MLVPAGPADSRADRRIDGVGGLDVQGATVSFGATTAVDDVSLSIVRGEVLALLGPSGCGKSTLLRAIVGLEPLERGTVSWDGTDVGSTPVHQRGFGLLFQDGQLFPHRDVAGNVEFGLRMAGVPRADRRSRVSELLDLVGLRDRERRSGGSLSGGEQQRVALARSLAPRPRLLLLDEPLSALDRGLRERLAVEVPDILRRTGTTALYVTHDHDEAFAVADRVAVMDHGRLLQTATPAELWRRPRDEAVARLLGYRWFVPAAVLGAGAEGDVTPSDVVALRPGSLVVDADGPLPAQVLGQRLSRAGTSVSVAVAGVGTLEARLPGAVRAAPTAGTSVRLRLEPGAFAVLRRSPDSALFGEQKPAH